MPGSLYRSFTDPEEYQAAIRAGRLKLVVSSAGKFESQLMCIDLHKLWMQRGRESLSHVTHVQLIQNRRPISFLPDWNAPPFLRGGIELGPGEIQFHSPGESLYHRTFAASRWAGMSLSPEDLAESARVLAGRDIEAPAMSRIIRPPSDLMGRLVQLHGAAAHLAETVPDILAQPEVARAVEQALVRAMIACLTAGIVVEPRGAREIRVPVMRRFARVLEANPDRPLYIAEICKSIGVAERTLRMRCAEELGMNPYRYLWLRRMHQVHRALMRADSSRRTVTELATEHGFGELGRFAVEYRNLFGESPSVTLRRAPDVPTGAPLTASGFPILP